MPVSNAFTDTATQDNSGTACPESNITVVKKGPGGGTEAWPAAAQKIMDAAGTKTVFTVPPSHPGLLKLMAHRRSVSLQSPPAWSPRKQPRYRWSAMPDER